VLLVLGLAASGCGGAGGDEESSLRGIVLPDRPEAPPLALHDQDGRPVTLAGERGRWVLVTFLYTYCPDVCPVIAGNLDAALRSGPGRRAGLKVLSVSVDPARDTPAAVRRYVRRHHLAPAFVWLLGTRSELKRAWRAYDVAVLPGAKGTLTHSTPTLLVDPEGRERVLYDTTVQTADVVHDLGRLAEG
jgi:protein SCO1